MSATRFTGLAGLANSLYVLLLGIGIPAVTFVLLIVEGVLGWFAFSVFVLSSYPFMVARAAGPMPGLSDTQSNALIMMVSPRCIVALDSFEAPFTFLSGYKSVETQSQ